MPLTAASASPLVSVVIPVRNGRDYIHEALDSVVSQDHSNLEVLIVDDGSTDFDYASLAGRDARIRVVRVESRGVSAARNVGMKMARGSYIAFLDADDVWFPGKLGAQVRYFEAHPEVGVVFGGFIKWRADEHGHFPPAATLMSDCCRLVEAEPERSGWLYPRLLMGLLVGMNTAVIRQETYRRLGGFSESLRLGEDYDFWLRASRITQMHALDGMVALYRIHGQSAMHKLEKENTLATLLTVAHQRWHLSNPCGSTITENEFRKRLAEVEYGHGYSHYWKGDAAVARRAFAKACLGGFLPFRSGAYFCLAAVRACCGKSHRGAAT